LGGGGKMKGRNGKGEKMGRKGEDGKEGKGESERSRGGEEVGSPPPHSDF